MGKRGPKPEPEAVKKARGSTLIRKRAPLPGPAPRDPSTARILTAKQMLAGIPGYDPQTLAGECRFDYPAARHAVQFFHERLTYPRGQLKGRALELQPWQQAIVGNLFGWKRPDGTRRYRRCFVYVAKKNGKTALLAGILLYVLLCDGEGGAGVFSCAYNKDQASLIYRDAAAMCLADEELAEQVTIYGFRGGSQQRSIVLNDDPMSSYRPLASDAGSSDGLDVHLAAVDEVHRHKSPDLIGILEDGTAARLQPIVIYITTADWNRESACNRLLKEARDVAANPGDPKLPGHNPWFLPVIYEAHRDDPWREEATWRKASPNLGVSIPLDYMREKVKRVEERPEMLNNFLRLHLNIVTDAAEAAFPMDKWDACGLVPVDRAALKGPCYGGLDLSKTVDQTAFALWWPKEKTGLVWYWIPEDTARKAQDRDRVPYDAWTRAGLIEQTPGDVVDYTFVRDRVLAICRDCPPVDIAFDPWNAQQMQQELAAEGLTMWEFRQGPKTFNEPCQELVRMVVGGELRHGGNAVLRHNATCLQWRFDANKSMAPDKDKSTGRIDGIVALIMAIGRSISAGPPAESNLEKHGIRRLGT